MHVFLFFILTYPFIYWVWRRGGTFFSLGLIPYRICILSFLLWVEKFGARKGLAFYHHHHHVQSVWSNTGPGSAFMYKTGDWEN